MQRQREILVLIAQGYPNKEIGLRLNLAEPTVKMHISAIFRALDVANRTQAVRAARHLGWLGLESVRVERRGDLAGALEEAVSRAPSVRFAATSPLVFATGEERRPAAPPPRRRVRGRWLDA